jgi:hypothetical protein
MADIQCTWLTVTCGAHSTHMVHVAPIRHRPSPTWRTWLPYGEHSSHMAPYIPCGSHSVPSVSHGACVSQTVHAAPIWQMCLAALHHLLVVLGGNNVSAAGSWPTVKQGPPCGKWSCLISSAKLQALMIDGPSYPTTSCSLGQLDPT